MAYHSFYLWLFSYLISLFKYSSPINRFNFEYNTTYSKFFKVGDSDIKESNLIYLKKLVINFRLSSIF